jgi:hypothetical protein
MKLSLPLLVFTVFAITDVVAGKKKVTQSKKLRGDKNVLRKREDNKLDAVPATVDSDRDLQQDASPVAERITSTSTRSAVVVPQVVLGVIGTNSCPESYSKITSWPLCLASLHILGPAGNPDTDSDAIAGYDLEVENDPDWPSSCYKTSWGVWFNEHPSGGTDPEAAPICAKDLEPVVTGGVLWIGDSDTDYWKNTGSIE